MTSESRCIASTQPARAAEAHKKREVEVAMSSNAQDGRRSDKALSTVKIGMVIAVIEEARESRIRTGEGRWAAVRGTRD